MRILLTILMFSFAFTAVTATSHANQDEGLYDPVAPEGSAFFRFINADSNVNAENADIKMNAKSYGTQNFKNLSTYYVSPKGNVNFGIGTGELPYTLEENTYYTVIKTADEMLVLKDDPLENMSKALITLYNLTGDDAVTLKTAEKDINIIENVANNASGFREINPVKLNLVVEAGNGDTLTLEPLTLERKNAYAIAIFRDEEGKLKSTVRVAKTDTTK